jgi:hypothetical protein
MGQGNDDHALTFWRRDVAHDATFVAEIRVYNVAFIDREEALASVSRALSIFRRLHLGAVASLQLQYVVTTAAANSDPACLAHAILFVGSIAFKDLMILLQSDFIIGAPCLPWPPHRYQK